MEKLFTPGPWMVVESEEWDEVKVVEVDGYRPHFYTQICEIGQGLPEAYLIAAAPELLTALEKAQSIICRLKLSMLAHPDCTEGSEFDDYSTTAQEAEDEIQVVLNRAYGKEVENG